MTADQIVREAYAQGLDPVEFAEDLGDGWGWDEEMVEDAVAAVRRINA